MPEQACDGGRTLTETRGGTDFEECLACVSVSIEVFDGGRALVNDAFSCSSVDVVIAAFECAIRKLKSVKAEARTTK